MVFDSSTISTSIDIPSIALPVSAASESAGSVDIDYLAVRKYSGSDPTITFGVIYPDKPSVPVVGFNANTTSGIVPQTVKFTDQSAGYPTSWNWSFGDGSNSTQQNPTHTYTNIGNYNVSLTVSNADGNNTTTKADFITVNTLRPPVASFSASPTSGEAPLTVVFTDASIGSPASWSWNFGDGGKSNEQNPVHTYKNAGRYTVKMKARNSAGSSTVTKPKYIKVTSNNINEKSPTSWKWNFAGVNTLANQNPVIIYRKIGTHTINLTTNNDLGNYTVTISEDNDEGSIKKLNWRFF
jgi:PKD repeat protein